jgi:ribosome recycling factor
MIEDVLVDMKQRMGKALEAVRREFSTVRTGKATTALLDGVRVDYYGVQTPLNQVASVGAPEARLLVVQPWEKRIVPDVVKAIQSADLGLNPSTDGTVIRIPIPPLTEERRLELVKIVHKMAEDGRVAVRNIRRDGNDLLKEAAKTGDIGEDEERKGKERIQEATDEYIKKIGELSESKETEIMEV